MTQTAFITKIVSPDRAEVLVQRVTACGGDCAACGGACAENARLSVVAINRIGALAGEKVKIVSHSSQILSAAALVYLVPIATFFIAYFIASLLHLSEPWAVVCSLLGLAAGLAVVFWRSRHRRPITFEIVERL